MPHSDRSTLSDMYREVKDQPVPADLATLWRELGVDGADPAQRCAARRGAARDPRLMPRAARAPRAARRRATSWAGVARGARWWCTARCTRGVSRCRPRWQRRGTHMVHQPSMWTSLGDVVGNVVLFVPVGMLGWALVHRWIGWRRTLIVLAVGLAFAFALQVAQLFVPRRDAAHVRRGVERARPADRHGPGGRRLAPARTLARPREPARAADDGGACG